MEQKINKEQLAKNYGKMWLGSETAWAAAKCGFEAGWEAHQQLLQQTQCTALLPDEVRFRCTRFAHQCRLKGAVTNKDTVELYDEMFAGQ